MLTADDVKGVMVAIVTPFDEDEQLDEDGLRTLTEQLIDSGVHAIMTTGGNGEFPHLLREEKKRVTGIVVETSRGRVPVIAGTAACSTRETILLTQDAKEVGADAAIVTSPYYFALPEDVLYQHYKDIATNGGLPVVIYNNPLYTGNNLKPELVARLAEVEGIIGLKQSNDDLGQLVEVIRLVDDSISICTGIDSQFYASLCMGARGIFSTAACVVPCQMVELYNAAMEGRHQEALAIHMKLQVLNRFLEYDPGYVGPCKEALNMLGLPAGQVRRPMPQLTAEERNGVRKALVEIGLL